MSFFNLYTKTQDYRYFKSLKVGNSIFALGEILVDPDTSRQKIITKLNLTGDILWEKTYHFNLGECEIINPQLVECTNGDILIMGRQKDNAKANYLARISSSNGSVIWQKSIKDALAYIDRAMVHIGNDNYILALWDIELSPSRVVLVKIDGNGNILVKKMIDHPAGYDFTCNGIAKGSSKIGLYGFYKFIDGGVASQRGLIIEVDFNLTQILAKFTSGASRGPVSYLIYNSNSFYSFIVVSEGTFISKSTPDYSAGTVTMDFRKHVPDVLSNIKHSDHNIYLECNNPDFTRIAKIAYDLTHVWTKKITYETPFYNNAEDTGILAHATNTDLIILGGSGTAEGIPYGPYPIARLNLELDSCKTQTVEKLDITNKDSSFIFSEVPYSLIDYDIEYFEIPDAEVSNITSVKLQICPTQPDLDCKKNKEICDIYSDLTAITNECLINPELMTEEQDFEALIICVNSLMNIIDKYIEKFPEHHLEVLFAQQIKDIDEFTDDHTFSNYEDAWSSLQEIVVYISGLGNCNCENGVYIDENTWLQSPNFYMQAAGSVGTDSTKGIHLRWAFSGILGERHMPKGNYATTYFNFNKPNDFVRVHRAKYTPFVFSLDFETPPQSINDAQHYWLYKFNSDTRIFFVYFKNATKYEQVRLTIDPFVDPILFIKNYGNEIIEIENKRELFFAVQLEMSQEVDPSLQLESLSVKENKLFTPKFLSFRKSYDSGALNDTVRLLCENGRAIRLKASNCLATKVLFEFYSDFINETSKKGNWEFNNNYALTKSDHTAIKRLEPLASTNPVNGEWLRFNDEAYVRVQNYIDKWNAPVDNAFDRNTKDIVSHYISLSNEEDNPTGTELINFNLSYETDPDEPLAEDELTEVNNLDILRIISTDYHIARMLGLGTLDIKPETFESTYIYLASYTTYGDLGNGPETVQHLSMSLPTSIYTERLPLAVEIDSLVPGFVGVSDSADDDYVNTHNGYSFDGKNRFISIVTKNLIEYAPNPAFYEASDDIDFSTFTPPVYAGIESRKIFSGQEDSHIWGKPELSNDPDYLNIDSSPESYETVPVLIPDPDSALYVDIQTQSGIYFYATYGINWFSRATSSPLELSIETELKPYNSLLPPSNILPHLIRKEFPLMFTSQLEQNRFDAIGDLDKTFIRLQFDYNADHELISYQLPETALADESFVTDTNSIYPDADEVMGDYFEIYFRNSLPKRINAKATDPQIESVFLTRIHTEDYTQVSTGEILRSELPEGTTVNNFIGGLFVMGDKQYVIHAIENGVTGLDFIVYNQQLSDGLVDEEIPDLDISALTTPTIEGDGFFMAVENMQNLSSWGAASNPHVFTVSIGDPHFTIHRELVKSLSETGSVEKYIEKTRGFWHDATIHRVPEDYLFYPESGDPIPMNGHRGLYKIIFNNFHPGNHPQPMGSGNGVEWFNGTVRLFTDSNMIAGVKYDSRKTFTVFRTENLGSSTDTLILYIYDPDFTLDGAGGASTTNDYILDSDGSTPVMVNYYPSYRVYLYHSDPHNLNEPMILPAEGEGSRYSIFGLRTVDSSYEDEVGYYKSKYSVPAAMLAAEIIDARPPLPPKGAKYTTRPDFYGKSTYTITTKYSHKPHGIFYYRADNQGFLAALYSTTKIIAIKEALKSLGGNEELYFTNRWENFLNFGTDAQYVSFPPDVPIEESYHFPLPDKLSFFEDINRFIQHHNLRFAQSVPLIPETSFGLLALNHIIIEAVTGQNAAIRLSDFITEAVMNVFAPLTEVPVIYKYIKNSSYVPTNKKQKIRNKDGYLIKPPLDVNNLSEITEFDMAPMMKNISSSGQFEVQFTDFTIDGTSDNVYFYAAKELSTEMKMSEFSGVLGPIKVVNSSPAEAPKIKSTIPVLENRVLAVSPGINFEITAYPEIQNIKKINLYRTFSRLDANSVQSMEMIKEVDIDVAGLTDNAIWTIEDDFSDLPEVPYGDALYYRLTISRKIEYAEALYNPLDTPMIVIDYAPSQPSKIIASTIVESYMPESPVVEYYSEPLVPLTAELEYITLHWNETVYKGNYRLYKLNSKGNWIEIARVMANKAVKGNYIYYNTNHATSVEDWIEEGIIDSVGGVVYLQLEMTNLNSPNLIVLSGDGTKLYHHFKVIAENTAGMLSKEENILTIYNDVSWTDVGGIAVPDHSQGMILGPTFRVR